ncbi:MAG: AAA family ATPase [Alphaproteobacteria bacterium]|nr:AAA family ATPase [Alphaproteobacteria bacterium]
MEVLRQNILEKLKSAGCRRYFCITASAGSGKSTLLRQWYGLLEQANVRVKLIRAENYINDERAFLKALIAACDEQACENTDYNLEDIDTIAELSHQLFQSANRLSSRFVLIIDDFHKIKTASMVQILTQLISLADVKWLNLVLASRISPDLPASSLQLNSQYFELNDEDFQFSDREVRHLLNNENAEISEELFLDFSKKVHGWAVALRLALVLVRDGALPQKKILEFSGTQREMARYISEHILATLNKQQQNLLIKAAVFPVIRMDVVSACIGEDEANELFTLVQNLGLPLESADVDSGHIQLHAVLLEFLVSRAAFMGISLDELRCKAAKFLATKAEWRKAIDYALQAEDGQLVGSIAEQGGGWRLIYRGEGGMVDQFTKIGKLLGNLYFQFPKTSMGLSIAAAKNGNIDVATHILDNVTQSLNENDSEIAAECRLVTALISLYQDKIITDQEGVQLEADIVNIAQVDNVRLALTQNLLCFTSLERNDFSRAIQFGRLSIASFRNSGSGFGAAHLPLHIGQAEYFSGHLDKSLTTLRQHKDACTIALGATAELTLMAISLLTEVEIENGHVEGNQQLLENTFTSLSQSDCWYDPLSTSFLSSLRLCMLANDFESAERLLSKADQVAFERKYRRFEQLIKYSRIRMLLGSDAASSARTLSSVYGLQENFSDDDIKRNLTYNLRGSFPASLRARILIEDGYPDEADELIQKILRHTISINHVPRTVRLHLLRLHALLNMNKKAQATKLLESILLQYPVEQYRLSCLEEGEIVIGFLAQHLFKINRMVPYYNKLDGLVQLSKKLQSNHLGDEKRHKFTDKEKQVLTYLDGGQPNKTISRSMDISENTVKFHMSNIFRKLDVKSRTAAAIKAREWGLIENT